MTGQPPSQSLFTEPWKILIIDDGEDDYHAACRMLKEARGHTITAEWACTYALGLAALRGTRYDAVLVGYDLDQYNGIELIREASRLGYSAPLILFTRRVSYDLDVEAIQAGAALYLSKEEANPLLLERAVRVAIERKRIETDLRLSSQRLAHELAERKHAEALLRAQSKALRESQELLERAQQLAHLGSWELDLVNNQLSWSDEVYRIFGLPPQEFGATYEAFLERVHPDDRAAVNEAYWGSLHQNRGTYEIEHRVIRADTGEVRFVHEKCAHYRDETGRIVRSVGMVHDISDRKRAEEALRQLSQAVEQSPASVVITDKTGTIEYVNPQFTRLTGYTLEEARGSNPSILKSGQTPPEQYQQMWKTILSGRDWQGEFSNRKKNGELYWEAVSISPITNERGQITHFVAVKEDITDRKQAHAALAETAHQLERSNRELELFAFMASHDLQEPLRKIRMFGDLLERLLDQSCPEEAQDYLNRMRGAAERMQAMINGLLELSRVNTRGDTFASVSLAQAAQDALSDLETRVDAAGGQVIINELPTIEADETQMRQLFQNLIGNAVKFHQPGVPPFVCVSAVRQPNGNETAATVQIEDNGIGFEPSRAEQIFQPFQRLHGRHDYEGTGLGLAICRKILERHHGKIEVHSIPGAGSTFKLTLPLRQAG